MSLTLLVSPTMLTTLTRTGKKNDDIEKFLLKEILRQQSQ